MWELAFPALERAPVAIQTPR
ncbi:protein of unknown function, partial [Pseudomonas sp. JV241A]